MTKRIMIWHEVPDMIGPGIKDLDIAVGKIPIQPIGLRSYSTFVIPDFCSDCIYCEGSCPNLRFDKTNKIMIVNTVACRGCGLCLGACPTGALQQRNSYLGLFEDAIIKAKGQDGTETPMSCNVCPVLSGEAPVPDEGSTNIRVLCTGRFEPALVLDSLSKGYEAIILVGCLYKGFPFERNKLAIEERLDLSKGLMAILGLDPEKVRTIKGYITEGGVKECLRQLIKA